VVSLRHAAECRRLADEITRRHPCIAKLLDRWLGVVLHLGRPTAQGERSEARRGRWQVEAGPGLFVGEEHVPDGTDPPQTPGNALDTEVSLLSIGKHELDGFSADAGRERRDAAATDFLLAQCTSLDASYHGDLDVCRHVGGWWRDGGVRQWRQIGGQLRIPVEDGGVVDGEDMFL
jgi:hypothetical protein